MVKKLDLLKKRYRWLVTNKCRQNPSKGSLMGLSYLDRQCCSLVILKLQIWAQVVSGRAYNIKNMAYCAGLLAEIAPAEESCREKTQQRNKWCFLSILKSVCSFWVTLTLMYPHWPRRINTMTVKWKHYQLCWVKAKGNISSNIVIMLLSNKVHTNS